MQTNTIGIQLDNFETLFNVEYRIKKEYEQELLGGAMRDVVNYYPEVVAITLEDDYTPAELRYATQSGVRLRKLNCANVTEHFEAMGMIPKIIDYIISSVDYSELCE